MNFLQILNIVQPLGTMGGYDYFAFYSNLTIISSICFILGFILVAIEMIYPGFGVSGISGVIFLFLGIILTATTLMEAFVITILVLAILAIISIVVFHSASKGRLSKKLILHDTEDTNLGYVGVKNLDSYIGKEGLTLSKLRPSGVAEFEGIRLDVISENSFIPANTKVRIIKVEGVKITVRKVE